MARTKQTARKTTKAPSSNLNNPAQDGNPDAVFAARRIVAYINESAPDGFSLAKLQDYAFETQENVQVSFLQENEQNGDNVVYIISMSGVVKIDQILREIPYKPKRQRGRKGMEMYQIARSDLDGVLKIANHTKNVIKPGEGKDESSSSDSGSEGEESGEESEGKETLANVDDAPRVLKKVKGPKDKKGKDKKAEVEKDHVFEEEGKEDNIEEEAAEVAPGKRGRGRGGKRGGGVSRVSKKKVAESGELATKNIDFDGEEGEEEKKDQGDENEDKKKKKKKEKPKSTQRKPVKTVPDTYKKGKFNTKVKVVTHHDLLQNKSNDPIDYGCTRTNNKNLIRAVYTQNYTLLDNLLRKHYFLSTLHEQWGPENETTALSLALKNRDVKAVKAILDYEYSRSYSFAQETPIHLQNVDTGNVSKAAFGVEIRKVNLMRGAREGNNAFTHDLTTHCLDFDALFELPMSKEILDYLRLKAGNHRIFSNIHRLIFSGDRINAGYLVNLANSVGGYGFNYLHEEALTKEKASELTPNIKRVSVTKKVIGNSIITPLHCAAINPNVEILDALLEIAPDYSIPDEKMRKLVHYAACCEKPGPLKLLISKGVDPREKDQTGLTPFMYACYYGRAENVEYLLKEASVDPLAKTKDGMMGSHWAASRGHLGVLKVLVENDVKMSVKGGKSKMTPLHFAAAYGYYDCVEYLVEHKSRVLVKDKFKRTPLSVAVRNGNLQIASYLLFNGSDFEQADSSNNFALHYAAAYGFTECIDILVKAGANVNAPNSWKLTALTVAMLKNNFHCVKALLAYPETDVNAKDDHGKSLISLLIGNPSEENFERIMYLIKERNCNVNTEDEDGVTPLHLACQLPAVYQTVAGSESLKIQLIKLLLEAGANINAKTKAGQFPLLFSITHFDTDLIELLIQQDGIDIAFHDRNRNNLYRLLYQHTIHNDERREFLKRILKKVGNDSNLLNELKNDVVMSVIEPKPKPKPKTQNQNYSARERGHRRKANYYNDEGDGEGDDEDEDREENEEEEEEIEEEEEDYDMVNNNIHTYIQPNPHATDPLSCNESAFTCFKRTLMNPSLQNYINTEINQALDAKRGSYGYSYYNYNVQLTEQETAECHEKAYNKFDPIITKNLDLIGEFVKAGATLSQDEASILRSEYSNDPRFLLWVLEMYKTDLNIADPSGNPVLYNLITRRNNLEMTPNAKQFLVDYLINHYGLEADTLSKYSDFKLFLEIYHRFGANFNYRNKTGTTPILYLLKTCDQKNADFLMDLIFYGADIHQARDNDGSTPFLEAIYFNDLKLLEVLVSLEVDINHKSKVGKAPLHYITEMNLPTTVTAASIVLKLKNIDVNIRDQNDDRTPLHYAILKGERDLVVVLLQAGADPNTTDRSGCNSLYFATQIRNSLLMREIGAITKNPSAAGSGGSSPLHLAVRNGTEEHVDILLKLGANPNAKDNTGSSPLHLAVRNGNEKQVEMLLKLGADPNLKDDTGKTSLLLAVMDEKFEIAKALLASGGNPNEKDKNDRTCLHYAVNNSKPEQMFEMEDMLIRNKADVNAIDIYGRTPLHYSFISIEGNYHFHNQNDPVETVTSLSAMEITNISLKDRRGKSPLHYAAENGAYICVLLLLKRQVAFDDPDADGNTPLALSLNAGHKDTAAILIQNKAKVSNMIHHINPLNYLWDDPKDNPYNHVKTTIEPPHDDNKMEVVTENEGEKEKKEKENGLISKPDEKGEEGMETEQPELVKGSMNVEEEQKDKESDDLEEEEEQIEEGGTEDLDPEELKTRELEMQRMDLPVEVQVEEKKVEQETVAINSSQFQRPVDSFFAVSIRRGWQGIAYLLLQNGFNLMEAIRDAMNEHQFKYVVALMTKVQDEVVRKSDHNNQNLFHIFAIKGLRAPVDLAKKIFEGLINRGVDSTSFDSFGKAPIHYAAENSFIYLEDRLLENKVDSNTLDKDGLSILHIAARTNNLNVSRLQKFVRYKIDINAMFNQYGRKMTPLHYIAEQGNEMVEREMLRLGADPNLEDSEELTALQRVFIRRSLTTSRLITYLNEKANINKIFNVKYDWSSRNYTLLLYAAEKAWSDYEDVLLNHGADARIEDEDHRTAFSISFSQRSPTMQLYKLRLYIQCQAPIRTLFSCKIRRRTMKVTPVLYLLNTRENLDLPFIKELLDSGVSINDTDDDGYSPIIYAIRRNNMQYLKLFLEAPGLDKNMRDKYGKTPIHHVVNPMDYASYENTEMLEVLAAVFDINAHDNREKPPIYYAYFQDSGTMKKALLELGAIDHRPANELQRQATSIIAGVEWPEEVDFEVDAEKYLVSQENSKMLIEKYESEPVDECAHNRHNLEVVCDETLGSYSLYMTKIDIKKGEYGEYLFYRMQVLYDKNRDNYILLTKWGRIGEQGMHQETPFGTKDECINEFSKIFRDKSGNEWKNKTKFQKFDHKYKLLNTSTRKNQNDYLQPIDWNDKTIPRSRLDLPIRNIVKAMSDVKLYHSWFGRYNINTKLLPFGRLSKDVIFEAKKILLELKDLIEELQGTGTYTDEDVQTVLKLKEKIMDNSSKYYELIPNNQYRFSPVQPIQNVHELVEKVTMVNDMIDFEVSAKILLGAMSNIKVLNPLDYCFDALGIRLMPLTRKQREHKLITQYVKNGYPGASSDFIEKIFALERRGEAERISQWKGEKNRMYLWHGSKLINFMGILSQGLRIAPPEAPATGYMFGKGIYFADTFSKSYGYCQNYNSYGGSNNNTKLLILCEVALGEIMEHKQANYITKLPAPYNSVLGRGRQGPDPTQNITLANGAIVPIGKHIQHVQIDENGNYIYYSLNYNEYIVYDVSQVRMRYLVQVK